MRDGPGTVCRGSHRRRRGDGRLDRRAPGGAEGRPGGGLRAGGRSGDRFDCQGRRRGAVAVHHGGERGAVAVFDGGDPELSREDRGGRGFRAGRVSVPAELGGGSAPVFGDRRGAAGAGRAGGGDHARGSGADPAGDRHGRPGGGDVLWGRRGGDARGAGGGVWRVGASCRRGAAAGVRGDVGFCGCGGWFFVRGRRRAVGVRLARERRRAVGGSGRVRSSGWKCRFRRCAGSSSRRSRSRGCRRRCR